MNLPEPPRVLRRLRLNLSGESEVRSVEEVELRDGLIFNQEALLNVYRCRFNIDTQIVPGGCPNN